MGEKKYTPGPWRWELNEKSKIVELAGGKPMYDNTVVDFARYGMGGAAPRFNSRINSGWNIMERAEVFGVPAKDREHHASWFKEINHPDARLIAAAPDMADLLTEINTALWRDCSHQDLQRKISDLLDKVNTL